MDGETLITQLKQGSKEAFALLYDRHWHSVCHFASLYLRKSDEIEDVVQEVFLRLWEVRQTLRDNSDLDGFLFIVTRNLIFTRRRRSLDLAFCDLTLLNALSDGSDASHRAEENDMAERVDKLVEKMPAGRRQVFEMSRRKYMSYREISTELGITEKTVERHINEALKYLKAHIAFLFTFFLILLGGR